VAVLLCILQEKLGKKTGGRIGNSENVERRRRGEEGSKIGEVD